MGILPTARFASGDAGAPPQSAASIAGARQRALNCLIFSTLYYLAALLGTLLSLQPVGFAIVWPATAVLTAAFLVSPPRDWWIYLLVIVPVHLQLYWGVQFPHGPFGIVPTQIAGELGVAGAGAMLVQWANGAPVRFDTYRSVVIFIVLAGGVVPAAGTALVLSVYLANGWTEGFWDHWRQWTLASIHPPVTITPVLVLAAQRTIATKRTPVERAEIAAACFAVFTISYFVFGLEIRPEFWLTLPLIPFPILVLAAIRQGVGGACLTLLFLQGAILVRAFQGVGPFAAGLPAGGVIYLQVFLVVISVPLVLIAALMDEWGRTREQARLSDIRMRFAAASTNTGLWQWDERSQQLWMTDHCRELLGLPEGTTVSPENIFDAVTWEDAGRVRAAWHSALRSGAAMGPIEFRVKGAQGDRRWMFAQVHVERDESGTPIRLSGVLRDATQRIHAQQEVQQLTRRLRTLQDDERRVIAQELHDSTLQHLVAIRLNLQTLAVRAKPDAEAEPLVSAIEASLTQAVNEIRSFTFLLRPPELSGSTLSEALQRFIDGFAQRTGLQISFRTTPLTDHLPLEQQHAMFRIVQEALANVNRHAEATRASVAIRYVAASLHLTISDNGHGFITDGIGELESPPLGVGIPGMAARIRQLGGRFAVRSGPGGTLVHAALRLSPRPEADVPQLWDDAE